MNMIEKVARAMAKQQGESVFWVSYTELAKAAIEAMREPSIEMVDEGMSSQLCDAEVRIIWTWMINVALKED